MYDTMSGNEIYYKEKGSQNAGGEETDNRGTGQSLSEEGTYENRHKS